MRIAKRTDGGRRESKGRKERTEKEVERAGKERSQTRVKKKDSD